MKRTDFPWHEGDRATCDDTTLHVIKVEGGMPDIWIDGRRLHRDASFGCIWPTDAVPDFTHWSTASAWLRSCAEVVPETRQDWVYGREFVDLWIIARDAINNAVLKQSPWEPQNPEYVLEAIRAAREFIRVRDALTKPNTATAS